MPRARAGLAAEPVERAAQLGRVAAAAATLARRALATAARADTIIVPPTYQLDNVPGEVLTTLRRAHARGRRIVSLCSGAFVLAAAGLLWRTRQQGRARTGGL